MRQSIKLVELKMVKKKKRSRNIWLQRSPVPGNVETIMRTKEGPNVLMPRLQLDTKEVNPTESRNSANIARTITASIGRMTLMSAS